MSGAGFLQRGKVGKMTNDTTSVVALALKPRDAAKALGISERLLWSWTNQGKIPCVRVGKRIIYPTQQLREWLASQVAAGRQQR
jgi:excisionase family DNA binding protein